ncbi:transcriptional regulator Hpr [Fictibacillus macauensis ZFHKF-1]|uniref:Transcriptional regulator Hpr n=1 Tax=Fictibacillus macauensis ZFHKF-1 TaxID=1196324 RepID=I8UKE5_9BACL|nr:winged helix DNA-binding protein [Fictibacillus macauensis]EIT87298.1 transcriptional regulator Hpr [Fictibacillus macauensis ZFHKF-1]
MSDLAKMHMMMNYLRGVYKVLEDEWQKSAKAIGLTQAEQHILWIVSFEKEATITRIAQLGLWDVSTVMQVIKRLKEKGFIQLMKKDHDRRISYVTLTAEGVEKQQQSSADRNPVFSYFEKWSQDIDKEQFTAQLVALHKDINEHFHGKEYVQWIEHTGNQLMDVAEVKS